MHLQCVDKSFLFLGIQFLGLVSALCVLGGGAMAGERGTKLEAILLVQKAVAHIKQEGPDSAFKAIDDPKNSTYRTKDLYVFIQDHQCTFLAHGAQPKLVGSNIWSLKNPNGRFACQDIVNETRIKGQAWTSYIFEDPLTGELVKKLTYSIGVGPYIVMAGVYN